MFAVRPFFVSFHATAMKLYGAFQKIDEKDDGTLIVSGFASSESVDSDGEIVTAAAMKGALPDYMKFGAVREMHQASAAGTAIEAKVDDSGKTEFSAHVVCGYLGCDARPFNPLLTALPRVIRASEQDGGALAALFGFALAESRQSRVGGASVLERLSELMFVEVVRRYVEMLPQETMDWLAGLRDPSVGLALGALHSRPAQDWSLRRWLVK